jgi:hypothetical protein
MKNIENNIYREANSMGSRFEARTKDGESHYFDSRLKWWIFRSRNKGNLYYIRINYY